MSVAEIVSFEPPTHRQDAVPAWLDDHGLLHVWPNWVALSGTERGLLQPLVERFGAVVPYDALVAAAWKGRPVGEGALNVLIKRARRRIDPLGLTIHNVRGRGYLVDRADGGGGVARARRAERARGAGAAVHHVACRPNGHPVMSRTHG